MRKFATLASDMKVLTCSRFRSTRDDQSSSMPFSRGKNLKIKSIIRRHGWVHKSCVDGIREIEEIEVGRRKGENE